MNDRNDERCKFVWVMPILSNTLKIVISLHEVNCDKPVNRMEIVNGVLFPSIQ